MKQRLGIALLAALALCGCATQYGDMGFTGGVAAQQMTSDTFRILARGNGYTSASSVQDFMLLKAAETTLGAGGTHFGVINERDASSTGAVSTPGNAHTSVIGNTAFTTYTPGEVHTYIMPGQDAFIRVFTARDGSPLPPGAMSADEIVRFVGARVKRRA